MLIYSTSLSLDGFIADRDGGFAWGEPDDEQFAVHLAHVQALGGHLLGRRLYETMLVWETDPSLRRGELRTAFADAWSALPKVVLSRTLDRVEGTARLASASLADEIAAMRAGTERDIAIGGAQLASAAVTLGLVDELLLFRNPILVGGGSPAFPPVTETTTWDLVGTRVFGSRVVLERYRRT